MEKLTMEKLLTDMTSVIGEMQRLVNENDKEGVKRLLEQIQNLIETEQNVELDKYDEAIQPEEGDSYDNVFHQLLSNIVKIKHEETKRDGLDNIDDIIKRTEGEYKKAAKAAIEAKDAGLDEQFARLESDRNHLTTVISKLGKLKNITEELKEKEQEPEKYKDEIQQLKNEKEKLAEELADYITNTNTVEEKWDDIEKTIQEMGEDFFKAHEIRKELADRNLTREDFLASYEEGLAVSRKNIEEIEEKKNKFIEEVGELFVDSETNEDLRTKHVEACKKGDEKALISIYEKIRKNMVKNEKMDIMLEATGFKNQEVTKENFRDFKDNLLIRFLEFQNEEIEHFKSAIEDQKENESIFNSEIEKIKEEQKSIDIAEKTQETLLEKSKLEKELRAEQIRATMYGADPKMNAKWNECINRFYNNKTKSEEEHTYRDKDGNLKKIQYETIKDYPEYEEDAFFLNLEDYKNYLELATKFRASGNDPYSLSTELIAEYEAAESEQPGSGQVVIEEKIKDMEEYVVSFHGHVNEHALTYLNHKTAGTTLKAMKPVKGVSPATVKYANAAENVFRFVGIRKPSFTKIDEHGNEVRDIPGGLLTLGTDALVIGGATAAVITGRTISIDIRWYLFRGKSCCYSRKCANST